VKGNKNGCGAAYAYLDSAICDHSRVACSEIHAAYAKHYSVEVLNLLTARSGPRKAGWRTR
jgi:hypothetical protein